MNFYDSIVDRRCEGKSLLEQCRLAELYLLDVFVALCERHHLRYFMTYGTLIGALRHNGFIPWDDDIDVGMPISDYQKFLKIAIEELPESLMLEHVSTIKTTAMSYAKIRDRSSFFCLPETMVQSPCGIYLDVFPFETLPKLTPRIYHMISRLCAASAFSVSAYRHKLHSGALDLLLSGLKMAVWEGIHKLLRFTLFALGFVFPKTWRNAPENGMLDMAGMTDDEMFPLKKHTFEGKTYCVPNDAEKMLVQLYGDWRTPPPEDKRHWHHSIICPTTPPEAPWARPYKGVVGGK